MPLTLANPGEETTIRKIGGKPEIKKHLEHLGFVPGGRVMVISAIGGNVIVNVKQSRCEAPDYGHGHHQRRHRFHPKSRPPG